MSHSNSQPAPMTSINKHFLLATTIAFGHIRSQSSVVCKLVAADPTLMFTIFCAKFFIPVVQQELVRSTVDPSSAHRIRVIATGNHDPPASGTTIEALGNMMLELAEDESEAYRTLIKEDSLTCTATGHKFDYHDIPKPAQCQLDFFVGSLAPVIREITPEVVIVFSWVSGSCSFLSHCGPAEYGGLADVEAQAKAILEKGDGTKTFDEVAKSLYDTHEDRLYPSGEGVKMYDYENTPQATFSCRIPLPVPVIMNAVRMTQLADATWIYSTRGFQPKNAEIIENWYGKKLGKKVLYVGPQGVPLTPKPKSAVGAPAGPNPFADIFTFLDAHPPKSVILISFGTVFYPFEDLWRIESVVKTLLKTRTPFIFSRASQMCVPFSPELEKALKENEEIGMVVPFVPQSEVLMHPSMGAFLTHGGVNSMYESICAGVVNIFWPQSADQPLHAAYMSQIADCAFELIQVRTGDGARPPARGGKVEGTSEAVAAEVEQVLADLGGPVGERKRKNLGIVRRKMLDDMREGGVCETALKGLLDLLATSLYRALINGFRGLFRTS